jgi:hypothetical protein
MPQDCAHLDRYRRRPMSFTTEQVKALPDSQRWGLTEAIHPDGFFTPVPKKNEPIWRPSAPMAVTGH